MKFQTAILQLNGRILALRPGKSNSFDELYVDFQEEAINGGTRYSIFLHPKQDVVIERLELHFDTNWPEGTLFFANGYQSWSESRLYRLDESIPTLRRLAQSWMGRYGDDLIPGIARGRGHLHSWTYTYFKKPGATLLAGSLAENTAFTLFQYDHQRQQLRIGKDLDRLQLSHSFPALDVWIGESSEQDVFDAWCASMAMQRPIAPPTLGWTSWYRYFNRVTARDVQDHLEYLTDTEQSFHYCQIDDGWQTAVGDWFSTQPSFPGGMGAMAAEIRSKGLTPGLWVAPFVASGHSQLVRQHPDWLLKDAHGRPLKVGYNPYWGGWYYALDFYHNGVRDYLSGFFHLAVDQWGYAMLKLDFLFAVCLAPPPGKTRGGVMWEAMAFLRELAGQARILACGAPLGACFGHVDYCRIGGDVHLRWEHSLLAWLRFRERVSTIASLRSTLGRWQLNGRVFGNDPDVFILRSEAQHLHPVQQQTLLTVNALLGALLFTSDHPGEYSPEQQAELIAALEYQQYTVTAVNCLQADVYSIEMEQSGARMIAYCNLSAQRVLAGPVALLPYESMILGR